MRLLSLLGEVDRQVSGYVSGTSLGVSLCHAIRYKSITHILVGGEAHGILKDCVVFTNELKHPVLPAPSPCGCGVRDVIIEILLFLTVFIIGIIVGHHQSGRKTIVETKLSDGTICVSNTNSIECNWSMP